MFGREVAAATYAATGNVHTAALKMAWPYPTPVPAWLSAQVKDIAAGEQLDNYVWENSEDALIAGSGNPQVRAGVLRLVSALPGITVTHGTTHGQPTLTLTAGAAELGTAGINTADPKAAAGPAYQEAITINAATGIPLEIVGGSAGQADRHRQIRGDPGQPGRHRRREVLTARINQRSPARAGTWPGIGLNGLSSSWAGSWARIVPWICT